VGPAAVQLDEQQQHVQPSQPDGVDGEAGRRRGSRRPADAETTATSCSCAAGQGRGHDDGAFRGSRSPRPGSQAGATHP
jgi:hypothetical protein